MLSLPRTIAINQSAYLNRNSRLTMPPWVRKAATSPLIQTTTTELHRQSGKVKSNIEEVKARGGQLFIFVDHDADLGYKILVFPKVDEVTAPIFYTAPLQLLSYHVALIKGSYVDQPRNLAKSVTVE